MDSGVVPDNHIKVIKLTPNATVEWSKVLDSGGNNRVYRIIQTPDNNLAVYCFLENENFRGLVKLSRTNGEILWKTPLFYEEGCGSVLALGNNGDIISAEGPNICRINSGGIVVWNHTTLFNGTISSLMETPDKKYIVGGTRTDKYKFNTEFHYDDSGNLVQQSEMKDRKELVYQTTVAKIDADGNVVWQTFLGKEDRHDPAQIIIDKTQGDYITQTESTIIRLDQNGKFLNATRIYDVPEAGHVTFGQTPMRYLNLPPYADYPPRVIFYNEQGYAVAKLMIQNASHIISPTDDGGYISATTVARVNPHTPEYPVNVSTRGKSLQIIKFNPNGTKAWETPISGITITDVVGIIQTSDGGYALVCYDEG